MTYDTGCSTGTVESSCSGKCCKPRKCICWGSVFAGAFVAIGLGFLVYLFTAGVGLTAFTTDTTGLTTLAIGGFIVLFFLSYFIMFLAGWTSGVAIKSYCHKPCFGGLHGFLAWSLALVIGIATHSLFMAASPTNLTANVAPAFVQLTTATVTPTTTTNATAATKATVTKATVVKGKTTAKTETTTATPTTTVTTPTEQAANYVGMGVLATFALFLIGAIGSWMGGYFGVKSHCGACTDEYTGTCKTGVCETKTDLPKDPLV